MLSRPAANISRGPLIRYVNLTINNPLGEANREANFDVTYDRNILAEAGENTCAIVNMALPLQGLPLFIFPIVPGQANAKLSSLQVGVCQNLSQAQIAAGTSATVTNNITALTWIPQQMGLSAPVQTTGNVTQVITPYYYCFAYEHFVNLVNIAMVASWIAAGGAGVFGAGNYPIFSYNETTNLFSWALPQAFVDAGGAGTWSICWNAAFDNLVNNFNTIDNSASYTGGFFILEDIKSYQYLPAVTTQTHTQDYPTTDSFNSAQRIVVLTNAIPIATDYFPAPFGSQLQSGGLSNEERILVDLSLDFDNNVGAQRSTFVYNPQIYQLSDMESTLPLRRISVRVMWCDNANNFYPIPLAKGDTVTIKLGFFNKGLSVL